MGGGDFLHGPTLHDRQPHRSEVLRLLRRRWRRGELMLLKEGCLLVKLLVPRGAAQLSGMMLLLLLCCTADRQLHGSRWRQQHA